MGYKDLVATLKGISAERLIDEALDGDWSRPTFLTKAAQLGLTRDQTVIDYADLMQKERSKQRQKDISDKVSSLTSPTATSDTPVTLEPGGPSTTLFGVTAEPDVKSREQLPLELGKAGYTNEEIAGSPAATAVASTLDPTLTPMQTEDRAAAQTAAATKKASDESMTSLRGDQGDLARAQADWYRNRPTDSSQDEASLKWNNEQINRLESWGRAARKRYKDYEDALRKKGGPQSPAEGENLIKHEVAEENIRQAVLIIEAAGRMGLKIDATKARDLARKGDVEEVKALLAERRDTVLGQRGGLSKANDWIPFMGGDRDKIVNIYGGEGTPEPYEFDANEVLQNEDPATLAPKQPSGGGAAAQPKIDNEDREAIAWVRDTANKMNPDGTENPLYAQVLQRLTDKGIKVF